MNIKFVINYTFIQRNINVNFGITIVNDLYITALSYFKIINIVTKKINILFHHPLTKFTRSASFLREKKDNYFKNSFKLQSILFYNNILWTEKFLSEIIIDCCDILILIFNYSFIDAV